jgi:hypothetical protein
MDKLNETSRDLSVDFLEVGLDLITDNELLREIPILGSLVKIAIIKNSISEKLLLKKLDLFLNEFDKQAGSKKSDLLKKLDLPEEKQKIGENLLLLIDKFDEFEKPQILAKIFVSYLSANITQLEFFRMGRAVNIAFIADLKNIVSGNQETPEQEVLQNILPAGLSKILPQAIGYDNVSFVKLALSDLGKKFIQILN